MEGLAPARDARPATIRTMRSSIATAVDFDIRRDMMENSAQVPSRSSHTQPERAEIAIRVPVGPIRSAASRA